MKLFVDLNLNRIVGAAGVGTPAGRVRFKRGDAGPLEVQFCRGATLTQLAAGAGTILKFAIKEVGKYDSDPLVLLESFTEPGTSNGVYTGTPNLNTTALDTALAKNGDDSDDVAELDVNVEFTWSEDSGSTWLSTETLQGKVENDVLRGDEGTPTATASPLEWLRDNGFVYDPTLTGITGGTATDLDGIATVDLDPGCVYVVEVSGSLYPYQLEDSTDAESGLSVVRPDDYATTTNEKVWRLQGFICQYLASLGATAVGELLVNGEATFNENVLVEGSVEHTPGTLTDGATINWAVGTAGDMAQVTLGGNRTLAAPTGITSAKAKTLLLRIVQDGTGGRTLTWPAAFKWPGGVAPTLSTGAGDIDLLTLVTYDGGTTFLANLNKDFS